MKYKLKDLQEKYDLELDKVVGVIKKAKAKSVLLQLPDFFKPYANEIADYLEEKTNSNVIIWLGSCFGACDIPKVDKIDLVVQFGHSAWDYGKDSDIVEL